MNFVDTHCHIQFADYPLDSTEVIASAEDSGVTRLLAVGCRLEDSHAAVEIAQHYDRIWASIGLHPHEGSEYIHDHHALQSFRDLASKPKVVAIGETGLDYHYMHSSKEAQEKLLRFQLDLAQEHNLPLIFHVREAFDDFWSILDEYKDVRGVVHSFSSGLSDMKAVVDRGLYVGLNGIMTFTKNVEQLAAAKAVPLNKLLLETDAPFLTPTPYRGTICEPKHVVETAKFLSQLRNEELADLARATTQNACDLFQIV